MFKTIFTIEVIFKILFVVALISTIFCLCVLIAGLFIGFNEDKMPEIEDVGVAKGET